MHFDAHEKPPEYLRAIFKKYKSKSAKELDADCSIRDSKNQNIATDISIDGPAVAVEANIVPGLSIYPNLLPVHVQARLLDVLFHRDLSNPQHSTNVNLHHDVDYSGSGGSFFNDSPTRQVAQPKDASIHKPLQTKDFLNKKLRWITLGGQYDWTNKVYPSNAPPAFPADVAELLQDLFPQTVPEAAIVNLYSHGDTLSMHRDVSEECDRPLISISIGCDALFVIGLDPVEESKPGRYEVLRLRSGDAVCMAGESRFAWHGVPVVLRDTCPEELRDWPCGPALADGADVEQEKYEQWRGWLASKRINLNVRQMKDAS